MLDKPYYFYYYYYYPSINGLSNTKLCFSPEIAPAGGLQAAVDRPEQIQGLLLVNPRFRQEHVAEAPWQKGKVVVSVCQSEFMIGWI